jgi:hypothetical protein
VKLTECAKFWVDVHVMLLLWESLAALPPTPRPPRRARAKEGKLCMNLPALRAEVSTTNIAYGVKS